MRAYRRYAVRRSGDGLVVASGAPLADVLDGVRERVVLDLAPDPGGPSDATALVALLAARSGDDVVVSSFDWYALALARDAGLRTAFATPEGVALGASLAYVTEAGHAECHPHWTAVAEDPAAVAAARAAGVVVLAWGGAAPDADGVLDDD